MTKKAKRAAAIFAAAPAIKEEREERYPMVKAKLRVDT
jgi:hypothetical protein